ncbi:MAG: hypothetical protein ACXAEI_12435 [Candidatus Hodarchaeales archaeon]
MSKSAWEPYWTIIEQQVEQRLVRRSDGRVIGVMCGCCDGKGSLEDITCAWCNGQGWRDSSST